MVKSLLNHYSIRPLAEDNKNDIRNNLIFLFLFTGFMAAPFCRRIYPTDSMSV